MEEIYLICSCGERSENTRKSCTCEIWVGKGLERKKVWETPIDEILFY